MRTEAATFLHKAISQSELQVSQDTAQFSQVFRVLQNPFIQIVPPRTLGC